LNKHPNIQLKLKIPYYEFELDGVCVAINGPSSN